METRSLDKINKDLPSSGTPYSHRNKLINGGFDIWQRGTTFNDSVGYYSADRWLIGLGGTGTDVTVFKNRFQSNGVTYLAYQSNSTTMTAHASMISQKIEGAEQFANKTFTMSIDAKVTSGTLPVKFRVRVRSGDGTVEHEEYSAESVFTTTMERINHTFSIPSYVYTEGTNESVEFGLVTSDIAPNYAYVISTSLWQVEEGSVATPFEQRPIAYELSLCQRYYLKGSANIQGYYPSTDGEYRNVIASPTAMRIYSPTLTTSNVAGTLTFESIESVTDHIRVRYSVSSTGANKTLTFNWSADAEL